MSTAAIFGETSEPLKASKTTPWLASHSGESSMCYVFKNRPAFSLLESAPETFCAYEKGSEWSQNTGSLFPQSWDFPVKHSYWYLQITTKLFIAYLQTSF